MSFHFPFHPMSLRFSVLFLLLAIALSAAPEPVRYTVCFPEARNHYASVEAVLPAEGRAELEVFLPVWIPGSYLVREYARHVDLVSATAADGSPLPVEKIAKNRWRIAAGRQSSVHLRYRLYGREQNVRENWIEPDHAFFNGGSAFLSVAAYASRRHEVRFELPAGWQGVYTALDRSTDPAVFSAEDFDTLVDTPILAGSPQVDTFDLDGVPHSLITLGGDGVWDNPAVARQLEKLARAQRDFWGALPTRKPVCMFNILNGGRNGIEHRQGFVLSVDRWLSRTPGGIDSWLSLASHEYFHLWNGKRLRPVELGPFDFEHEVYTRSLWAVEGITSYYQPLMLLRAGILSRDAALAALSGSIAGAQNNPGRHTHTLAEASFDAWIKAYRPDENTPNTTVSYYTQGAVAALLLDAEIRRASHGAKSLDDVMRAAFARHSGARGFTEAEFAALASATAGADLSGWFARVIHGTGELDYQPMLDWYGLAFADSGSKPADPKDPPRAWLGADTKNDDGRLLVTVVRAGTPAYEAGLSTEDEILALDNYRVRPEQLAGRLNAYRPGDKVTLLVARLDALRRLEVTLGAEPAKRWKLTPRKDATPEQAARLNAWLGTPATGS